MRSPRPGGFPGGPGGEQRGKPQPQAKRCVGTARFSAVGPSQATGAGALAAFGVPGHVRGNTWVGSNYNIYVGALFMGWSQGAQLTGVVHELIRVTADPTRFGAEFTHSLIDFALPGA